MNLLSTLARDGVPRGGGWRSYGRKNNSPSPPIVACSVGAAKRAGEGERELKLLNAEIIIFSSRWERASLIDDLVSTCLGKRSDSSVAKFDLACKQIHPETF